MSTMLPAWHQTVPLVLDWEGLQVCLDRSTSSIIWHLSAPYEMGASLSVSSSKIAAGLYVSGPGVATITVTINTTTVLTATVTVQ